jgi:hypothetical protein
MKITGELFPGRAVAAQPKQSFSSVMQHKPLQQQKPLPSAPAIRPLVPPGMKPAPRLAAAPSAPLAPTVAIASQDKVATVLANARAALHQNAAQLQQTRAVHHELTSQRLDARLVDLICKELVIEFTAEPSKSRVANQDLPLAPPVLGLAPPPPSPSAPTVFANPEVKAAQAVELIERIETFIKDSRRPTLALTLNNSLGAKVEIERVGPREVALKIVGHKGPPTAEDVSRIREEMQAHGLKVCALSVS